METVYIPVTIIIILLLVTWFRFRVRSRFRNRGARVRPCQVLDAPSFDLYHCLVRALPEHLVFPGVSYSRFLEPSGKGSGRKPHGPATNLQVHSADFLICRPAMTVVAVISLRRDPDAEALLREAAIPLLRYEPGQRPDETELHETIRDLETLGAVKVDEPELPRARREPRL